MSNQEQRNRSRLLLQRATKDVEQAARALDRSDIEDINIIARLQSILKDIKAAKGQLQ